MTLRRSSELAIHSTCACRREWN